MIDVADAQADGARLLAIFAKGGADALAEIFDQATEKFRVDGAAFDGGFAGNGFGRGREQHFAAVEAASALPDLLADDFAESRLQSGFRHLAELADGGDATLGQRTGVDVADAVKFFDGQRCQESFFFAGGDHAKAARAFEARSDGGDHFCACRADGNAEAGALANLRLHAAQRGLVIRVEALGAGEVEVKVVQRGGFHRGRVGFEDAAHALGKIGVVLILSGDDDGLRADAQGFAEAHRGFYAAGFGFVARRGYAAAAYQNGFAAQLGIEDLLDRGEKGVYVNVDDVGNGDALFGAASFATTREVFLRAGFA